MKIEIPRDGKTAQERCYIQGLESLWVQNSTNHREINFYKLPKKCLSTQYCLLFFVIENVYESTYVINSKQ